MKLYFHKTPGIIKSLFPRVYWDFQAQSTNEIYLTFDDGPNPEATPFVIDQLAPYNFKATFFCIGSLVQKHPEIIHRILDNEHSLGNHTYNHLNGWKNSTRKYIDDVIKCNASLSTAEELNIFRPPFGKASASQLKALRKNYKIIMWDFMIGDFDNHLNLERSLRLAIKHLKPGAIVVFHDSAKALPQLKYILPRYLEASKMKGFISKAITKDLFE
ncbi:MAG: polysaccharide deacetylase family protein [Bacteroidetes bacterium]|nr:polysaccharide deacetylase family protein [Bacteroidota bacterium]MDA1120638.1 polysaccharide deacetylase family protein [Bacteroidota bacterium]